MKIARALSPAVLGISALSLAACGQAAPDSGANAPHSSSGNANQSVTIFAAASLTDVMKTLTAQYSQSHPGVSFNVNYGASSTLVQQLSSGAKADLIVTADESSLNPIRTGNLLAPGISIVASNDIVLALAPNNPGHISSLAEVARSSRVAVCAPAVPCGKAAKRVLDAQNLSLNGPSQEPDVSAVKTKVSTGQVDAGFIYATDAKATEKQGVTVIRVNDPQPNKYPAALTTNGANHGSAVEFKQWLSSSEAVAILKAAGFGPGETSSANPTSGSISSAAEASSPAVK